MTNLHQFYSFLKIIHLISVISFMAGILYLPRLFVYHSMQKSINSEVSKIFEIMERKLIKYIINPAFIISGISGLFLAYIYLQSGLQGNIWIIVKFILFLFLGVFHGSCSKHRRKFLETTDFKSEKFFRFFNEIPTIIMILIIIIVVLKPF